MQLAFDRVRAAHGAFDQAAIALIFEVGGGRKPAFKRMLMVAGQVVHNHADELRGRIVANVDAFGQMKAGAKKASLRNSPLIPHFALFVQHR